MLKIKNKIYICRDQRLELFVLFVAQIMSHQMSIDKMAMRQNSAKTKGRHNITNRLQYKIAPYNKGLNNKYNYKYHHIEGVL